MDEDSLNQFLSINQILRKKVYSIQMPEAIILDLDSIAVENYFIVHSYVSNDRTDYNTLIPVLEKHKKAF